MSTAGLAYATLTSQKRAVFEASEIYLMRGKQPIKVGKTKSVGQGNLSLIAQNAGHIRLLH
ncbi:MAG: hypothetical protein WA999_10515 [Spirulinaceae cyanobacterium]